MLNNKKLLHLGQHLVDSNERVKSVQSQLKEQKDMHYSACKGFLSKITDMITHVPEGWENHPEDRQPRVPNEGIHVGENLVLVGDTLLCINLYDNSSGYSGLGDNKSVSVKLGSVRTLSGGDDSLERALASFI